MRRFICLGEFVYIIDSKLYKIYLRKGFYKYIPEKLLIKYQHKIKPRKVCEYFDKNENTLKGYGLGVFISYEKTSKDDYISRIIQAINTTKTDNTKSIILDDIYKLNELDYEIIEKECELKIYGGRREKIDSIIESVNKICSIKNEEIIEQEILLISDGTEDTKRTVMELSKEVNFLTVIEKDKHYLLNLEREVLLNTGLAIHSSDNTNISLLKYDFIICMQDDADIDVSKIRKKTIVIDTSPYKSLYNKLTATRKDLLVISDYIFKNESNIISIPEEFNFKREIPSYIYEALECQNGKRFIKVRVNDKNLALGNALSLYSSKNQSKSVFHGK